MKKSSYPLWIVLVLMVFLCFGQAAFATATVQQVYTPGVNTWNWGGRVITGTLTGGSDTVAIGSDDLDMVISSYNDQASITLPISWSIASGLGVVTLAGDTGELYTAWLIDWPGF